MNARDPAQKFLKNSVDTATPGEIILMLFDGSIRFMNQSIQAFEIESIAERNERINTNLIRAQNIILELKASLDMSVEGKFGPTMERLYEHIYQLLLKANREHDKNCIHECIKCLKPIRDAWAEMLNTNKTPEKKNPIAAQS